MQEEYKIKMKGWENFLLYLREIVENCISET